MSTAIIQFGAVGILSWLAYEKFIKPTKDAEVAEKEKQVIELENTREANQAKALYKEAINSSLYISDAVFLNIAKNIVNYKQVSNIFQKMIAGTDWLTKFASAAGRAVNSLDDAARAGLDDKNYKEWQHWTNNTKGHPVMKKNAPAYFDSDLKTKLKSADLKTELVFGVNMLANGKVYYVTGEYKELGGGITSMKLKRNQNGIWKYCWVNQNDIYQIRD